MDRRWHDAAHIRQNEHQDHGFSVQIVLRHMKAHGGLLVLKLLAWDFQNPKAKKYKLYVQGLL